MENNLQFLSLDDLDDQQLKEITLHLNSSEKVPNVVFPWSLDEIEVSSNKGSILNANTPAFEPSALPLYQPSSVDYSPNAGNYVYPCIFSVNNVSGTMPLTVQNSVGYSIDGHVEQQEIIEQSNLNCNAEHFIPRASINNVFPQTILPAPVLVHNAVVDLDRYSSYQKYPFPCESNSSPGNLTRNNVVPVLDTQIIHSYNPHNQSSYTNYQSSSNPTINSELLNETSPELYAETCCDTTQPGHLHVIMQEQLNGDFKSEEETNVSSSLDVPEPNGLRNMKEKVMRNGSLNVTDDENQQCPIVTSTSSNILAVDKLVSLPLKQEAFHSKSDADHGKYSESKKHELENQKTESVPAPMQPLVVRSFADVLKSKGDNKGPPSVIPVMKPVVKENGSSGVHDNSRDVHDFKELCFEEDKSSIQLGRYLHQWQNDFTPVCLQPRGLINRRTWCYINATLQALLACSPFYTLLRNLPIGPAVDRGKSSTPIIDSMISLVYKFTRSPGTATVEDLQVGSPFQPDEIYDMLCIFKSHCLKGLQEDAEEFLSFILNGMHEEMVSVLKYYENKYDLNGSKDATQNGHVNGSEGDDDEWKLIGVKQRGMVTRNVAEHPTPISNLLGGQIKSFLTSSTNRTASVQPFFTLQLDIQSDIINSVEEALSQMTVKEPIQGYICPKTKQEVEAYSNILLQKLPPILILHLKRFVYNKTGGCKKVMKHTEYPMQLEFKKDLFSPEAKKTKRPTSYKLFAVTYHDGVEAVQGHYISDIYHNATKSWIRCDDSTITSITEMQVFSHSPPKVPYLLFYQASMQTYNTTN